MKTMKWMRWGAIILVLGWALGTQPTAQTTGIATQLRPSADCAGVETCVNNNQVCMDDIDADDIPNFYGCNENTGLFVPAQAAGGGAAAPINAEYLTLALHGTLTAERTVGTNVGDSILGTDGGADNPFTMDFKELNVLRVCKTSGDVSCEHATVTSALAAVSGESATNRFAIVINPGDYDERFTMKGFTSLVGVDKQTTRIRGDGAVNIVITVPDTVTETGFFNITIGGRVPIQFLPDPAARRTFYLSNSIIGIVDGTEQSGHESIDSIIDNSAAGSGRTLFVTDTIFRSTFDTVLVGSNWDFYGSSLIFEHTDNNTGTFFAMGTNIINFNVRINGFIGTMTTSNLANFHAFTITTSAGVPTQDNHLELKNALISLNSTNAANTSDLECFEMNQVGSDSGNSHSVDFDNVTCEITAAGTSAVLTGLRINNEAGDDLDDWTVTMRGGQIKLAGGTSRTDVQNDEADANFIVRLDGVENAGVFAGAGIVSGPTRREPWIFAGDLEIPESDTGLANRGQVRVPTATDGFFWRDSAERQGTADDHTHTGAAGQGDAILEVNVTMDDATGHVHSGAGGNGTIVTDLVCTDCVSNVDAAEMAANTIKANATASLADPADFAIGANTILGRASFDIVAAQLITAQVTNNAIDNSKLENMVTDSLKGRFTAATGDPEDILTSTITVDATPVAGDFIIGWNVGGDLVKYDIGNLPAGGGGDNVFVNTAAVADADFGTVPVAPASAVNVIWATDGAPAPDTVSAHLLLTDIDGAGIVVSGTELAIGTDLVTNVMLTEMAANTFKVRNGALGDPQDIDAATFTIDATPAAGNLLLGFDSNGAGAVIRLYDVGNLPAGSETNTLTTTTTGIIDDQMVIGDGVDSAAYHTLPEGILTYTLGTNTLALGALANLSDVSATTGGGSTVVFNSAPAFIGNITTTGLFDTIDVALHNHEGAASEGAQLSLTAAVTGILPTANGGTGIAFFTAAGPTVARIYTFPDAAAVVLTDNADVTVAQGGTGLSSGTDGGILGYTATGTLASSALLAASQVVLGGGAGATPTTLAAGTAFQHLRMNSGATAAEWQTDTKSKSITIEDPDATDVIAMWLNEAAVTVLGVSMACAGGGTNVAFEVEFNTSIATGGTVVHSDTCVIATPEFDVTPSGTAAVVTDRIILIDVGTLSGAVTDLAITVHYRENA